MFLFFEEDGGIVSGFNAVVLGNLDVGGINFDVDAFFNPISNILFVDGVIDTLQEEISFRTFVGLEVILGSLGGLDNSLRRLRILFLEDLFDLSNSFFLLVGFVREFELNSEVLLDFAV